MRRWRPFSSWAALLAGALAALVACGPSAVRKADAPKPPVVTGPARFRLTLGKRHACVLEGARGSVSCWGENGKGQLGIPTWEHARSVRTSIPWLTGATDVAAGDDTTCVVGAEGGVRCWWPNRRQALAGLDFWTSVPERIEGLSNARAVSATERDACAVTRDGAVTCWSMEGETRPVLARIALPGPAREVVSSADQICALLESGEVACWVGPWARRRGEGGGGTASLVSYEKPGVRLSGARALAVASMGACALTSTGVYCWRSRDERPNGLAHGEPVPPPFVAVPMRKFPGRLQEVASGWSSFAADYLSADVNCLCLASRAGEVVCSELERYMSPYCPLSSCTVPGRIDQVELEGSSLCVLFPNGAVDCNAERPNGTGAARGDAAPIAADVRARYRFVAGENHSCLLDKSSGALSCDGGTPGDGSDFSWQPVRPKGLERVSDLSAGSDTTCAVNASGELFCWGLNQRGERGDGGPAAELVPMRLKGLPPVARVVAAERAACARLVSGELRCWGDLSGRPGGVSTPRAIPSIQGAREIAVGDNRACAALENGDVRCFCESGIERTLSFATAKGVGRVAELALTHDVGCARLETGAVKCFRFEDPPVENDRSERCFRDGSTLIALEVPTLGGAAELAVYRGSNLCAVSPRGSVRCFDTKTGEASPVLADLVDVAWLASTPTVPCFVGRDGGVRCLDHQKGLVLPAATYEKYEPDDDVAPDGPPAGPELRRLVEQRLKKTLGKKRLSDYRATGARPMRELAYGADADAEPDAQDDPICDGSDKHCAPGKRWRIEEEEHGAALIGDRTYWIVGSILEDIEEFAWAGRYLLVAVSGLEDDGRSSVCVRRPWIMVFDLQKKLYFRFDGDEEECRK